MQRDDGGPLYTQAAASSFSGRVLIHDFGQYPVPRQQQLTADIEHPSPQTSPPQLDHALLAGGACRWWAAALPCPGTGQLHHRHLKTLKTAMVRSPALRNTALSTYLSSSCRGKQPSRRHSCALPRRVAPTSMPGGVCDSVTRPYSRPCSHAAMQPCSQHPVP